MTSEKIARINALAKKAKAEGLTPAEQAEQQALRKEYLADIRRNVELQLQNAVVVDEKGNHTPLTKKNTQK